MARARPELIHSVARRPVAGFWSRLVASAIAPFGFGGDLWSRRDHRWRQHRVERLFAGFFATLVAFALISFRRSRPGREAVQRQRVRRLLRGYHRALIVWALEPYRFAWAWELGEGQWTRGRVQSLLAQCFMVPFAWAALDPNGRIDWRRLATRRMVGGLSMTMVACTAMAFGSGPSFEDHRDESQAPRLMASYGAPVPDVPTSDADGPDQGEGPSDGGAGGSGGGAPQNGGSGGPAGDAPASDGPDFPSFDSPPSDGLMTLANYTPPTQNPPGAPEGENAAPGDNGNPGGDPANGGLDGLPGLGGGGGGLGGGGGGGGGGFTPPNSGDPPGGPGPGAGPGPGNPELITIATSTPEGDGGDGWDGCMVDCSMTPPSGSPAPPSGGPQPPGPFGPPDNSPLNGPNPPITAVPEPTTWVMLLLGFGGLGAAIRRRRRQDRLKLA